MNAPKGGRNRRKSTQGSDQVKHRRTRSGCYTCRSRRVKCDETHPTCERCRKGSRDCVYPEPATLSKSSSSSGTKSAQSGSRGSPGSSTDDYEDDEEPDRLGPIQDENEGEEGGVSVGSSSKSAARRGAPSQISKSQKSSARLGSETPSLILDKDLSPTPSTDGSIGYATYANIPGSRLKSTMGPIPFVSEELKNDWARQPADLQFYLVYFYENVTQHHYALKHDSTNFLRTTFLEAALRNDALLHAVVGFSAFQRTLHCPGGKMQDFLQYYNKAVSLLLRSLMRKERRTFDTLLAILQLATIEEYLGDWINLLGHQKAAYEILTELYNPQTIMQTELTRVILEWYARFDVFAGLLGGFQTVLSRNWFFKFRDYYIDRALREPENIHWKIEEAAANLKLIGMEMSILFAAKGKGEIADEQFIIENDEIGRKLWAWKINMDPALKDSRWLVTDFERTGPPDPYDIVDPYIPGILYRGPLWTMNILNCDWHSVDLMHKYQTALILQSQPSEELTIGAYATCQLFEAIEYWPESPKGSIVACQASLGIACLFLPRDSTHNMWCRRKLAVVESNGYIYPLTFRTKMTALFQDPTCMHWWLPDDENYPTIIRSIRSFVEERTAAARDVPTEDLRDMKAIFSSLNLDDGRTSVLSSNEVSPEPTPAFVNDSSWSERGNVGGEIMLPPGGAGPEETKGYGYGFDTTTNYPSRRPSGGGYGSQNPAGYH